MHLCTGLCPAEDQKAGLERDYHVTPAPFSQVHVEDSFWTARLSTSRLVTIPYCFEKCEETGRVRNFEKAAGIRQGKHEGIYFDDSDLYKVMEGAAYSLQVHPETMMRLYLDKLIAVMAAAQWEDGYLYTFYSLPERQPEKRWTNEKDMHEQYCAGHLLEAAVAHYQVTGNKSFLDIATPARTTSAPSSARASGPIRRDIRKSRSACASSIASRATASTSTWPNSSSISGAGWAIAGRTARAGSTACTPRTTSP